jgi:hypothetical protein
MLEVIIDAIRTRSSGTRLVFLSDFDGTLADFHDNPVMPGRRARRSGCWRC